MNQLAELNQRRGKEAGDRMVCHVAQVLRRRFGPGNVYRINGDEFVVFRTDVTYRKFAGDVEACQQLLEEQAPGAVAFGWTWADQDIQIQGMVHHAGEALQLEKKQRHGKGKGAWGQQAFWGLEEAFAKGHFHIYLQPKAEIASGRIRGPRPLSGTGMTNTGWWDRISSSPSWSGRGLFVTSTCLYWRRSAGPSAGGRGAGGGAHPHLPLNLSRYTLMEKGILARINGITSRYQVDRRLLKLEITESIGDVERRILEEISREIVGDGYCLSLDDFGAQYSNLSILSSLQLSELKIDKSIINDLYSNQNTRILVEHLIHICRQLGIDSVAEGVEEREQLQILEDIGCTYAQGYLYNKPIPVPDFERKYLAARGMTLDKWGNLPDNGATKSTGWEGSSVRQCMDADNLHRRFRKIIGQVQAIDRMVDEDIPCEDILSQINAAKSALNKVGQVVLEGHIKHCVRDGLEHGDPDLTIAKFTKAVERFANMT